eukprot:m.131074 g.131074  ORF g.131074 m.131074 type:complete len:647 (-) comp29519_c1_seq2:829-2769(-)
MTMMLQPVAMQGTFVARDFHDADLELTRLRIRRADERRKNNLNLNNTSSMLKSKITSKPTPTTTVTSTNIATQDSHPHDPNSKSSENLDRDYVTSTSELSQLRSQRQNQRQNQHHKQSIFVAPDADFLSVEKDLANFRLIKAMQKIDRRNDTSNNANHNLSQTLDRDYATAAADVTEYRRSHPLPIEIARDFYQSENELVVLRLHKSTLKSKAKEAQTNQTNKPTPTPTQSYAFDRDFTTAATELTHHRTNMAKARALVPEPDVDFLKIEQQLANYRLIKMMQKADVAASSSSSLIEGLDRNYSTAAVELTQYRKSHPLPTMISADRDFTQADIELALLRLQRTAKATSGTTTENSDSIQLDYAPGIDRDYSIATREVGQQRVNLRTVAVSLPLPDPDVDILSMEKDLADFRLIKAMRKADQSRKLAPNTASSLEPGTDRDYANAEEELKQYRTKFPPTTTVPMPTPTAVSGGVDVDRDFLTAETELATFRFIKAMQQLDRQRQTTSSSSSSPTLFDRDFDVAEHELAQFRIQRSQGSPLDRDCVTADAELATLRHRKEETRRLQQQLRELQQQQQQQSSKNQTPKDLSRRSSISDVHVEMVSGSPSPYDFMTVSLSQTKPTPISTFNDRDFMVAEQELIYLRRAR